MIEDMTHLQMFEAMARELQAMINHFNARASGVIDKDELLALRTQQNIEMTEVLRQQRRHLDYHAGKPVKPEAHSLVVTMAGEGGTTA